MKFIELVKKNNTLPFAKYLTKWAAFCVNMNQKQKVKFYTKRILELQKINLDAPSILEWKRYLDSLTNKAFKFGFASYPKDLEIIHFLKKINSNLIQKKQKDKRIILQLRNSFLSPFNEPIEKELAMIFQKDNNALNWLIENNYDLQTVKFEKQTEIWKVKKQSLI